MGTKTIRQKIDISPQNDHHKTALDIAKECSNVVMMEELYHYSLQQKDTTCMELRETIRQIQQEDKRVISRLQFWKYASWVSTAYIMYLSIAGN